MEFQIGDMMVGEVTGVQPYGAFIRFPNGENGLIHISEISSLFFNTNTYPETVYSILYFTLKLT